MTFTLNAKAKDAGIKVTAKGKVVIPKKCKPGNYSIVVRAAGNNNYKAGAKSVKIKVTTK